MATETLNRWMPTSLDELREALDEISLEAKSKGHCDSTVYVDVRFLSLEEVTLSDGSRVVNLVVKENK